MKQEIYDKIKQIIMAIVFLAIAVIIDKMTNIPMIAKFAIYLIPYFIAGFEVLKEAFEGIKKRRSF